MKIRAAALAALICLSYQSLVRCEGDLTLLKTRTLQVERRRVFDMHSFDELFNVGFRLRVNQEFLVKRDLKARRSWGFVVQPYTGDTRGYLRHLGEQVSGLEVREQGEHINTIYTIDPGVASILDERVPARLFGNWSVPYLVSAIEQQVPAFKCGLLPMDTPAFERGAVDFQAGTSIREILNSAISGRGCVWTALVCDRGGGYFPLNPELGAPNDSVTVILMLRRSGK